MYTSVTGTSANITGLNPATTYKFTVKAKDGSGNVSLASAALTVTTLRDHQSPSVPTGLFSENVTETGFVLMWTPSTDNVTIVGYDVYKNGNLYATVTGNSANITGLTAGTTCFMFVKAKDAAGNTSYASNILMVTTLDLEAPSTPSGLAYLYLTGTGLLLTWNVSTDNVGVIGYDVYKNGVLVDNACGTSSYISHLLPGNTYSFTVKAKDMAGNASAESTALQVTTPKFKSASEDEVSPILIYPNPAGNVVNIQLYAYSTVKITDIEGKVLFNKPFEQGISTIPLNLESGVYIIQVFVGDKNVYSGKLMVK